MNEWMEEPTCSISWLKKGGISGACTQCFWLAGLGISPCGLMNHLDHLDPETSASCCGVGCGICSDKQTEKLIET